MFSNELFYKRLKNERFLNNIEKNHNSKDSNRKFIKNVLEWNFGLKGVLKVGKIYFHKVNDFKKSNLKKHYRLMKQFNMENIK